MADQQPVEYRVVVNEAGQYSLQPSFLPDADGWVDAGCRGSEDHCLAFIREAWTDMRPIAIRRADEGNRGTEGRDA